MAKEASATPRKAGGGLARPVQPSPELGAALASLLHSVIGEPALNSRDWLLAEAERLLAGRHARRTL